MKGLFYLILPVVLSCASKNIIQRDSPLSVSYLPPITKDGDLYHFSLNGLSHTVTRYTLVDSPQAKSYAMERRLLILRKFEVMIEPYFGTANAKNCQENLKSSFLLSEDSMLSALLQVPVKGEEKIIHDCLIENNSHWANIQFLVCTNVLYDIRTYVPIDKPLQYRPTFICE